MFLTEAAPFIDNFLVDLESSLNTLSPPRSLSRLQRVYLGICLTGILLTHTVCWAKFERASLGSYKISALSWVFRKSCIPWSYLLLCSVKQILKEYDIKEGELVIDESDRARSKRTTRIHKTHKQKHKASGGYVNGQTIVLLLLVASNISFPVGFAFYQPDPSISMWRKEDKRLKKHGVPKKDRPKCPERNKAYPTKTEIGIELLNEFKRNHPKILIHSILVDALYGEQYFMSQATKIWDQIQVISQLRENQIIENKNKKIRLDDYFNRCNLGTEVVIIVRGGVEEQVTISSARVKVKAHGEKRFVIALKYEGEKDYRYLVATDMTWRTIDIVQAYGLRWLIEVFFEDWKLYEGWGREAKQLDEEGSSRGLILSLLFDHCLLLHPEQKARIKNKLPACTVGSLLRKSQTDVLLDFMKNLLEDINPVVRLKELSLLIDEVFVLMPSSKHMIGRDLGRLEPSPSLKYRSMG